MSTPAPTMRDTATDADAPEWASAIELAARIRDREVSPVEVVGRVLDRISAVNPRLNAIVTVTPEAAMREARAAERAVLDGQAFGPLHGVPFTVKDTTDTAGVRTTMGSRLLADNVPASDAVLVARLRAAGAILVGKTNTPEFACKAITDNALFGPTRNPWDTTRTPGGSSGGAAAAVAAGLGPIATGNDAGGSIRIPASCCGVVGLKPQFGRVPSHPCFPHWETLSHEGPIARTVADCALMLDLMAGPHLADRHALPSPGARWLDAVGAPVDGLRAAYDLDLGYARCSAEVRAAVLDAVDALSALGLHTRAAGLDLRDAEPIAITLINAELAAMIEAHGDAARAPDAIHPLLRARVDAARGMSATTYLEASFARRRLSTRVGTFFEDVDLLVTPTLGTPAWPLDAPGGYVERIDGEPVRGLDWSFAHPFNLTGQPAISIPWAQSAEGLPIGLQLVGRPHREDTVLAVAAALERARPWRTRRPALP